ncbi:hypothetical protein CLV59_108157 [Chitinophaga dinghuensis]|uniref:Carboxypeptidase family protein n=1 Tax=Chitinophaga dinghuensis TaxID=1539050 RepID=A0A327VRR0_9BACT|nr:carboxypeptidase-like regulatory domain-containing protein [Chitinophaga dinghuensis]RAJ76638.1 hypothetical protein CLV59_108157 [Chitinophaga dinghuensis]
MNKFFQLTVACSLLIFAACNKESIPADYTITPGTNISSKQISAGVQGIVLDEKNRPVSGAAVSCGNSSAITDQNGAFQIPKADMREYAAVAIVKKAGYFNGFRTFQVTGTGKTQFVQIQLLPKKAAGTFDASKGGTINASNAQFTFTANQVLDGNNQPYAGKASLIYAPINPEDANFASQLPGDLRAINSNNEEVGLKSYGMMALELQGENGEKLHLDGKQDVNFKMTIPASLQASAPSTIPLWHFDEADGLWKEEGKATKSGDSYVGTVKHFSFWNCDAQFPLVQFQATFQDANGIPLGNMRVTLTRADGNNSYATTDMTGTVKGGVPANEQLTLTLRDKCNEIVYTKKIDPLSKDTDLGKIAVTFSTPGALTIKGQLITCNNTPVKNGAVAIKIEGVNYAAVLQNGSYQATIIRCNTNLADATITAVDTDASKASTTTIQVTAGVVTQDVQACDNVQYGSVSLTVGSTSYSFNSITDSLLLYRNGYGDTTTNTFFVTRRTQGESLSWTISDIAVGTYTPTSFYLYTNTYLNSPNIQVNITQTGNAGQYISGSISGTAVQPADSASGKPSEQVPISGTFRILRQN